MTRMRGIARSVALLVLLCTLSACGHGYFAESSVTARPAQSGSTGNVDPPLAETPRQALSFYLDAVEHGDCGLAELYTTYEFHGHGDICDGPSPGAIAFDDWRLDPQSPPTTSEPDIHNYAVDLHITKHGCAGSICSNGWHTWFLEVRGNPDTGYLLTSGDTSP